MIIVVIDHALTEEHVVTPGTASSARVVITTGVRGVNATILLEVRDVTV